MCMYEADHATKELSIKSTFNVFILYVNLCQDGKAL